MLQNFLSTNSEKNIDKDESQKTNLDTKNPQMSKKYAWSWTKLTKTGSKSKKTVKTSGKNYFKTFKNKTNLYLANFQP
jgi:hypothetical protein